MESPPTSKALKRARLFFPINDDDGTVQHAVTRCSRPGPLLVAAVYNAADLSSVDIRLLDVSSGAVVARLDGIGSEHHFGDAGGLVCLVSAGAVRALDPATGAATDIANAPGPGDAVTAAAAHGQPTTSLSYVFGQVPATGEYKLLRICTSSAASRSHGAAAAASQSQSCEIVTLGGRSPRWRQAPSPPVPVAAASYRSKAVARGVAHFLPSPPPPHSHHGAERDAIASFDLATEAWRPSLLRGPLSSSSSGGGGRHAFHAHLSLAELNGSLAAVHHDYGGGRIDVWALTEPEKGAWARTHSLRLASVLRGWGTTPAGEAGRPGQMVVAVAGGRESVAQPLAVLDDGRIALWVEGKGVLRVFDPRTGACMDVADMGRFSNVVGLYTAAIGG